MPLTSNVIYLTMTSILLPLTGTSHIVISSRDTDSSSLSEWKASECKTASAEAQEVSDEYKHPLMAQNEGPDGANATVHT